MLELFPFSHCFDVDMLFSISYWNVHGLNEEKLEDISLHLVNMILFVYLKK
jgi:hypothetical protein